MKIFLSLMMMMISIMMFFLNHPLSMGLMILIQTIFICMLMGMLINTYWFSYILFLTFLGGLLILFIYVSSIASNEMFKNNFYNLKILMISTIFICFLSIIMFNNNLKLMNSFFNNEMEFFFNYNLFFNNENKINLSKLYNNQTFMMMMMMMIYLFIALVTVVKIMNIFYGPLRQKL